MWLLQKSSVGQVGHYVPDGSGAEVLTIAAGQRTRAHGFAGGDVGLHDSGENLTLPPSDAFGCRHNSPIRRNSLFYSKLANNWRRIRHVYSRCRDSSMSRLALA